MFWQPPLVQALSSADFFVDGILPDPAAAKPAYDPNRWLVLWMDNPSPHRRCGRATERRIVAEHRLPFSPDLALVNFFLFGALKAQPADHIFESVDEMCH
jgi:hypothetical protein